MRILFFALVLIIFIVSNYFFDSRYADFSYSPNWSKNQFANIDTFKLANFFDFIKWQFERKISRWEYQEIDKKYKLKFEEDRNLGLKLTFIGQSTFIIQYQDVTILTDPVFSDFVSSFGVDKVYRLKNAKPELDEISDIDFVFISHNHADHLDLESISIINSKSHPKFIVPLGVGRYLKQKNDVIDIVELDWWEKINLSNQIELHLTPAMHWSQRTLFDQFKTLWAGCFISFPKGGLFFAGDSGYGSHFSQIRQRLGSPKISILPIGTYKPISFMKDSHMSPSEAVQAHIDLNSRWSLGMHFATFQESDESFIDPLEDLDKAKIERKIINFGVIDLGESVGF